MRTGANAILALCFACAAAPALSANRRVPQPLPTHPGSVFLASETVVIQAPKGDSASCRLTDYEGRFLREAPCSDEKVALGRLEVGYYEVLRRSGETTNRVSLGVVERLRVPTPADSPVCSDAALAWLVPPDQIGKVASLATLAGVNWIRDRLNWPEIEPARSRFVESNRYDFSISEQARTGLQVLEVTHISPKWANPTTKRFPLDLRDAYEYHQQLARRWRGQVAAFEPWNEADIDVFGGHTGSEMASLQKAAYLGLKAGNPKAIGCLNVFAIHRRATLDDFAANQAWPYFDTFNLHHYEPFAAYPKLYADFRSVSAGKPLWVTECSLPVKWTGDPALQEPTWEDQRVQSERVPITYALALHERASAVFFFILPHFVEGQTQFGLLHRDLTPRPGFLALAAVGRLLADAQPLGRLKTDNPAIHGYVFRAKPDGKTASVLVIWSDSDHAFQPPVSTKRYFDHLGREQATPKDGIKLSRAPVYVVLPPKHGLSLVPPPEPAQLLKGKASALVLQALMPEPSLVLDKSAYQMPPGARTQVPLFLYNFGSGPAQGHFTARAQEGWKIELPPQTEIRPGERLQLPCFITSPTEPTAEPAKLDIAGDFGSAGPAALSFRCLPITEEASKP